MSGPRVDQLTPRTKDGAGQALDHVRVNATGTALEFAADSTREGAVDLAGATVATNPPDDAAIWLPRNVADLAVSSNPADRQVVVAADVAWEETSIQEVSVWFDPDSGLFKWLYSGGWADEGLGFATSRHPLGPLAKYAGNPVLGQGGGGIAGEVGRSSVFVDDDGTEYVYYTTTLVATGDLHVATGPLPSLTPQGVALAHTATATAIQNTSVVKVGSTYHMIFESLASTGAQWQMGHATASSPLGPFTVSAFPLPSLQRGTGMYGGPFLTVEDDGATQVLLYHASTSSLLPTDIYRATATDFETWTQDPTAVVTRVVDPPEHDQAADPCLLIGPWGAYLLWEGVNNTTGVSEVMATRLTNDPPQWTDGDAWYPFIEQVQSDGTPMTRRAALDFVGVTVTDDAANDRTTVTLSAAGELLMQDGVTTPPVPVETEDGSDWLYEG